MFERAFKELSTAHREARTRILDPVPLPRVLAAALALLGAAAGTSCGAKVSDISSISPPPVALLTAFDPFGGKPVNASWEAIKAYDGATIAGYRIAVARLPVVYDEMAVPLSAAIQANRPALVIAFGLGRDVIHVERVAKNAYNAEKPKDNLGRPPPRDEVVPGGAASIPTALPADAILAALNAAGLKADPSEDAGGYLCNECFYRLMGWKGRGEGGIRARGFVHLPDVDAPNPAGGTYTLERLREAVRIVVETTAASVPRPGP